MTHHLLAFALLSLLVAATPGPDSLLVLRSSLNHGRGAGARVAAGAAGGSLVWGATSAAGLTAILAASADLYRLIQFAGAVYLVTLGLRGWLASHGAEPDAPPRGRRAVGFRAGLVSNVLNPKVGLFFVAVLPQFAPAHAPGFALVLALVDAVIAAAWLAVVAWLGERVGACLRRPRVRRTIDRAAALTLVGLGLSVAVE